MFMFLFLFFSMLLLCSFFRLKELFQVKNGVTTSFLFFFFENAKNLGRSDDGKRRKKQDGLGKPNGSRHFVWEALENVSCVWGDAFFPPFLISSADLDVFCIESCSLHVKFHSKHPCYNEGSLLRSTKHLNIFTFTQNLLSLINLAKVKKLYLLLSYKRSFIEASALSILRKLLTWAMQR